VGTPSIHPPALTGWWATRSAQRVDEASTFEFVLPKAREASTAASEYYVGIRRAVNDSHQC